MPASQAGRRRPTVGWWLVLLIAGFFLGPLCISNLWGYLQSRRYLTQAAFRNIRNVAALEASETREFVRAAQNLVPSIVAGNQHLFGILRRLESTGEPVQRRALERELRKHLVAKAAEGSSVEEFQVLSAAGVLLASSKTDASGMDLASSPCFQKGRERQGIVGFDYRRPLPGASTDPGSTPDGEAGPGLVVAASIREGGGALLGVFCARFGFDIHRSLLVAHKHRTSHASLYLLDERGRVVCGSFEDIHHAPYGTTLPWLRQTRPSGTRAWESSYRGESGAEVMVAYAPVPNLKWGVVVEVPVKQALADLERMKWEAVGASMVLAAVLAGAAFLSWRTIVRPLRALSHVSDRMASGAPGETVSPRGPREVTELATAFNRMSLALRDSQETLETRIAERTRELRESQEFLELLLDSIDQRVVVVNRNYEIIKANAAARRMHGRGLVGSKSHEAFEDRHEPPEDFPPRRTFETERPASAERSQRTIRGLEPVYVETYPVVDSDGKVASVVEIGRVVTAEKQLQMQMVYQEKMAAFGQLAAGMAHEIGNPLAAIESELRMAQDEPGRAQETLGIVRRQVGRMDRMLRELVDFSRRRRDEMILASANQIVEDVARLLEHDPRARAVTIGRKLGENLPGVRMKEDQLVQVLLNLGLNALDATPDGGSVEFQTEVDDGRVTIRVRDTGAGIGKTARAHLFEPFFTTKGPGKGTGLGLFVSKEIIEAMGGVLELERTGPEGTTFAVRLRAEVTRPGRPAR